LIVRIAERSMGWPFRSWAFGEAIVLEGLLAAADIAGRPDFFGFVHGLARASLGRGVGKAPEDHVAPGRIFLILHERLRDGAFLDAARALAALHRTFPKNRAGARMPRAHLPGWREQIWVDSMDIAPPFLAHLGRVTGEPSLYDEAAEDLLSYARLLQEGSGLLRHGYEQSCGPNGQIWARGNGWALLGMVETLDQLPATHPAREEISQRIMALLDGLKAHQDESGLWHTVIDRPETYAESTLAAMVATGVRRAAAAGIRMPDDILGMAGRAHAGVLALIAPDGGLMKVSDATPVAELSMYATRPFGIFPWGQGPLLLMVCQQ
jgi:unsaturated rhamnogalacturonyl hydrolase